MATTAANIAWGATSASPVDDPFTAASHTPLRHGALDTEQLSLYSTSSPTQARRALEAHLKDTDRRIQDASRLGTNLLQQRKDLSSRLEEVKQVQQDNEVPAELRKKLSQLEKEYDDLGRESARAFLPKSRVISAGDPTGTPSAYTGAGRESPTKLTAPSRRQRNQPSNRVHDIEFATEISTSLLAQVRQLQTALAEKDESLKDTSSAHARLEGDVAGMLQRIKHMDENEQRYKDENWNLETRLQELEASFKDSTDREARLGQNLKSIDSEKAAVQRELDDLRVSADRSNEEHAAIRHQHETDLYGLRRDAAAHDSEREGLQKRVDELAAQNAELAKAVSSRWNMAGATTDTDFVSADEDMLANDDTPEHSEPASPVKGTPRHGMLESETLKSSLNHAHRMIQNLKNNIHREKTEKIELKRMLQDARDELEARRSETGISANVSRKRRSENDGKFRKPAKPSALGANRNSTTEVVDEDEPDWEDHDDQHTPSKSLFTAAAAAGAAVGAAGLAAAYSADHDTTDAFETATEREATSTDAFETGRESQGDDDSDELTETESGINRASTIRKGTTPVMSAKPGDRYSFMSTASTSADDEEDEQEDLQQTPSAAQLPKYRLRMNRSSKRSRMSDVMSDSPRQFSPSSFGTPQPAGQSLGDELDALDESSVGGTPSRASESSIGTPQTQRLLSVEPESPEHDRVRQSVEVAAPLAAGAAVLAHEMATRKPAYADAGVMTDPWEPEPETRVVAEEPGLREKAEEVVGGALAGIGLGWLGRGGADHDRTEQDADEGASPDRPATALEGEMLNGSQKQGVSDRAAPQVALVHSNIVSQETVPLSPARLPLAERTKEAALPLAATAAAATTLPLLDGKRSENIALSPVIVTQDMEPDNIPTSAPALMSTPALPSRSLKRMGFFYVPAEQDDVFQSPIPGTDGAKPGLGFLSSTENADPDAGEPKVFLDNGQGGVTPLIYRESMGSIHSRPPLGEVEPNTVAISRDGSIPPTKPLQIKRPMADEGSQTLLSGDEIEGLLRNKSRSVVAFGGFDSTASPARPNTAIGPNGSSGRSVDAMAVGGAAAAGAVAGAEAMHMRSSRRPSAAASIQSKASASAPPLPEGHTQKIAAAARKAPGTPAVATAGTMGPPLMPASAYKQNRPITPASRVNSSRDGPTPRAVRPATGSRRTSVSSFASELDERFNLQHGHLMYPDDVRPPTDPRMIQAITQTMIGEYLWKYTRKAGRSETSSTRHRRFFWVHPYTRTLYWSDKDPSTAGRDMLKAKSVAIEAVRVITDDNAYPPGLHRKSLVVVTPGREIVFTAPTGQRHETWFNALSYLLLRTEGERASADEVNQEDLNEFNPGFGSSVRRSISRMTGRSQSRASLSSYNSRNSSPSRAIVHDAPTLAPSIASRQAAATPSRSYTAATYGGAAEASTAASRQSVQQRDTTAGRGRLSSITSRFRGSRSVARGRTSTSAAAGQPRDPSDIYDASVVDDSAEDLRAVMERQEREADRLENVRACCDGKHDVGSLSHKGSRSGGLTTRLSSHALNSHSSRT